MSNGLIVSDLNQKSENRSLTTDTAGQNQAKSGKSTQISRKGLSRLASDQGNVAENADNKVASGAKMVGELAGETLSTGAKLVSKASQGFLNLSNNNKNAKNILFGIVGSIFGLSTIKELLDLPKRLLNKDGEQENKAPILLKAGQVLSGAALAVGAFKTFTGAGLTNPALVIGLGVFLVFKALNSTYENENSIISKVLTMLGLRDRVKDLVRDTEVNKLVSN